MHVLAADRAAAAQAEAEAAQAAAQAAQVAGGWDAWADVCSSAM